MNLQQFLEEEFKDYGVRMSEDEDHFEFESPSPSKILDFTNKVLDEVNNKVGELYRKYEGEPIIIVEHMMLDKISTIINQLKLK